MGNRAAGQPESIPLASPFFSHLLSFSPSLPAFLLFVLLWLSAATNNSFAAAPQIVSPPQPRTVIEGASHTFQVTAAGSAPLAYQWFRNGSTLPAATTSLLTLSAIQTNQTGLYSVRIWNGEGSVTSVLARLTVRTTNDALYPAPASGWSYLYEGAGIASSQTAALDGTWNHELDSWAGDGRGAGNGLPGGLSATNGVLTIEDAVTSTTGGTFNNRRFQFTHSLAQEPAITNASTLLNDGVTLTFRARLTPAGDSFIELTNAPNGLVNNSDGKGMFGLRQAGSSGLLVGFSLAQAVEDTSTNASYNFGQAGLHMNHLNGGTRTNNVDPGEPGTPNVLPLDPAVFHEFWVTIQDNGNNPGTHRVKVWRDGALTSTGFDITAGTGSDGPATNYLALGLGSTAQRGAVDVDFFGYRAGVIEPSAFNQPVGISASPVSQFVAAGQLATFNVGLTGTPPFAIRWYQNGTLIPGATNAVFNTMPVTPADEGALFTVIVANEFNAVTSSPPAELHLLGPPVITAQPASLNVTNGDSASLTVLVSSSVTPTYQWRLNAAPLASQTNSALSFIPAGPANAGAYSVVVSNSSGSITSQVATLTVVAFDYGDAPDAGYQTLRASNGARHRVVSGIYLGASVDVDLDGLANGLADGDDNAGVDDEDGVSFPTAWVAGQAASVQVVASVSGVLSAWVDWNHDGMWNTAGDQVFTNRAVVAGMNTLSLTIPANALAGSGHARFRFATTGNLSPFGPAADGEVEDYVITFTPRADLGVALAVGATGSANPTAPVAVHSDVTFTIQVLNSGPSIATGVTLTNAIPASASFLSVSSSQGACFQTGDRIVCELGAVNGAATALVNLTLRPTTTGTLGIASHVSSAVGDPVALNNSATASVSALEPPTVTVAPQSRTVTNGSSATMTVAATGAAPLRHQWHFGGAPLAGQTNATLSIPAAGPANDGTYFVRITNLVGVVDSAAATLSVIVPPAFVTQPVSLTNLAGSAAIFTLTATGSEPLLYQWRYNGALIPGETSPTLAFPEVRLTNAGSYSVTISNVAGAFTSSAASLTVIEMDFGDAPAAYPTALAANGARHRIVSGIRLGAAVDYEPTAQSDAFATGDDLDGADDEDGVVFNSALRTGQTVSLSVVASASGLLNAWVDFNRNTSWADAGEQVFINRPLVAGTNLVSFVVPPGASLGSSMARFRFSTASGLSFVGEALNGEVEDYAVQIGPAADVLIRSVSQFNPVAVGSSQNYSIVVSNAGPSVATGVSLNDSLPAGSSFIFSSATQGGCTHSAGLVVCSLGTLNVGGTASVTLVTTIGTEGTTINSATVGASQFDLNLSNNSMVSSALAMVRPAIVAQPESRSVMNGSSATFRVAANGSNLRYQWLRNGTALPGATLTSFTIPSAQPANEGGYSVRITNEVGVAVSATASLSVLLPVTITAQPQSQTVLAGSTVTFTVAASGTGPFNYQWEWNGSDVLGQTGASLVLNNVQTNQSGAYQVRISNALGPVLSAGATLTIFQPPVFTLQPQGQTNPTGSSVTFTAAVIGSEPLRQQWYFNRTTVLAGQTNSTLTLTGLLTNRSGDYTLVATNLSGASTSAVAVLAVFDMDFGDAPQANGYPTTLAFNGARHRVVPGIRLGANIDSETNGLVNATATGDDLAGVDDEDGVVFPNLFPGQMATLSIVASTNGFIDAWMDFNGNGAWSDPGEQVLASRAVVAGNNLVPVNLSSSASVGSRMARIRFSSAGGLSFDGFAPDGEAEDYQVSLLNAVDLQLGMTASANPVPVSSNLTYTISVTNRGPSTAGLVWVTNALPPSFTFVSAARSGGQGFCDTAAGGIVYCLLDDMPVDRVAAIELTVRANATGSYTNRAWVFSIAGAGEASPSDNTNSQSTVVIGAPVGYSSLSPITVADATTGAPGKGNPYPSTITVSGLTSALYKVRVAVSNITHDFAKDFDLLLVGPRGQTTLLMSDAGATTLSGVSLLFDDAAADPLPSSGVILSGTYRPSNYGMALDVFPVPAPAGPYGSSLSQFNNTDPNGTWSLYVVDGIVGGLGVIQGGWRLELSTSDPIADLAVTAVASSPGVALGSNLVYSVTLTNRGPAVATAVRLTNALPAGAAFLSVSSSLGSCINQSGNVVCDFGSLNVGAGASVVLTVMPNTAGFLTNVIRASAAQLDLFPTNHQTQIVTLVRPITDLAVAQVPSTNLVLLGQTLTYTLQVTNRGPNAATLIRLTDTIPATANFVSAVASQGSCSNAAGVVWCELGGLPVGGRAQVALSVVPTLIGLITNTARVASEEIDSLATNNDSTLVQNATVAAELSLSVTGGGGSLLVGSVVTYNIVVTNRGPASAPGATLTNVLPAGFNFVSASSSIGGCVMQSGTVLCSMVSLDADSGADIVIRVTPTLSGPVTNTFTVGAASVDFVPGNNAVSVQGEVRQPPFISTQPLSRTVISGSAVTFSVVAGGAAPLLYQWSYNGGNLPRATNSTFSLPVTSYASRGNYQVRISNSSGSVASIVASLVVLARPTITDIPNQQIAEDTATANLPFVIGDEDSGAGPLTITVGSSDLTLVPLSGIVVVGTGSNRTVRVSPVTNRFGATTITVRAADAGGLSAADTFVVTVTPVNDLPTLSAFAGRTMDQNTVSGAIPFVVGDVESATAALTVSAASTNTLLFPPGSFGFGGAGANRTLVLTPALNRYGTATVTVTVTDLEGGLSSQSFEVAVALTVFPPSIVNQPLGRTVTNGAVVTFSITAAGTVPIFYQWKHQGLNLPGATNALLTLPAVTASNAGAYTLVATNAAGSAASDAAVLRVLVSPRIGSITRRGGLVEISFSTIAGLSYTVEFSDAPGTGSWSVLRTTAGNGGNIVVSETGAVAASRIYRVRVQ